MTLFNTRDRGIISVAVAKVSSIIIEQSEIKRQTVDPITTCD